MKKKVIFTAILAITLALVVSCDDGSGSKEAAVPAGLAGFYEADEYIVEIRATGRGSINGEDCIFGAAAGILTVKHIDLLITVKYTIDGGAVTFSDVQGSEGFLKAAFEALIDASPITPSKTPPSQGGIPAELVGNWNSTADAGTVLANTKIFVINANGTGSARNSISGADDTCTWSVNGNKLTLSVYYSASPEWGTLKCTFDYAIKEGKLELSNPVSDSTSSIYSALLEGYVANFPAGNTPSTPGIDDFTWVAVSSEFVGTWKSAYFTWPIFVINTDGTGTVQFGTAAEAPGACSYKMTADKTKLLLDVGAFGKCMYTVTLTNGNNTLTLTAAVPDATGTGILEGYTLFTPVNKE